MSRPPVIEMEQNEDGVFVESKKKKTSKKTKTRTRIMNTKTKSSIHRVKESPQIHIIYKNQLARIVDEFAEGYETGQNFLDRLLGLD